MKSNMSNKSISVYAEAMKRQKTESPSSSNPVAQKKGNPKSLATTKVSNKNETKQSIKQINKLTSKHVYMKTFLDEKPLGIVTFRVPDSLLDKFDEMQYLLKKNHKKKLTRYSIVTAALAFLFWDYEERGVESELFKILVNEVE